MTAVTGKPEIPSVAALEVLTVLEALEVLDAIDVLEALEVLVTLEVLDAIDALEALEILVALEEFEMPGVLGVSATPVFWSVVAVLSPDEHPASDEAITHSVRAAKYLPPFSTNMNSLPNFRTWVPPIVASQEFVRYREQMPLPGD